MSSIHSSHKRLHGYQYALLGGRTEPLKVTPAAMQSGLWIEFMSSDSSRRLFNFLARSFQLRRAARGNYLFRATHIQKDQLQRSISHLQRAHGINRKLKALV